MGQPKNGGYQQLPAISPEQLSHLSQLLQAAFPNQQQAAAGFQQFLPGGGGGQPIIDAAQKRYQQQTIPSITNLLGSNSKSSSALNQALGASAADLNSNLAAQLSQLQLGAASGLAGLGSGQSQLSLGTQPFAYQQRQPPLWQQLLLQGINTGGQLGSAAISGGF